MTCPASVYTTLSFACTLYVVRDTENLSIQIDFGDSVKKNLEFNSILIYFILKTL